MYIIICEIYKKIAAPDQGWSGCWLHEWSLARGLGASSLVCENPELPRSFERLDLQNCPMPP